MKDQLLATKTNSSNNRRWMEAYRALVNKLAALQNIPQPMTHDQTMYIRGFEDAANEFKMYALKKAGKK